MKSIFKALIFAGSLSMLLSACSKDYTKYPTEEANPFRGTFTAFIGQGGEQFKADEKNVVVNKVDVITTLSIWAKMYSYNFDPMNYKMITLAIGDYKGPATYLVDVNTTGTAYTDVMENVPTLFETKMNDETAYITIESDNGKQFKGKFHIVVKPAGSTKPEDEIIINQGEFNVEI